MFTKQIKLFVGIEQVVILAASVVRLKHVQEVKYIKILLAGALLS